MEDSGTVTAAGVNQDADRRELMTTKPLHRFAQKDPKSLGIVILIFGCVEILMGFLLTPDIGIGTTSSYIYIPFWQGILFLVCGNLSIYTGIHPSKKMVTVCMAMYLVSVFGIAVSLCYRSWLMAVLSYRFRTPNKKDLITVIEALLFVSSLCVSVLLIFLFAVARLALKSTRTQIIVHQIPPPATETPAN